MKTSLAHAFNVVLLVSALTTSIACARTDSAAENSKATTPVNIDFGPPARTEPTEVTVLIQNKLIGQIRQLAMGIDGWTAIGSNALELKCTNEGGVIKCYAFATEPYVYSEQPTFDGVAND